MALIRSAKFKIKMNDNHENVVDTQVTVDMDKVTFMAPWLKKPLTGKIIPDHNIVRQSYVEWEGTGPDLSADDMIHSALFIHNRR